MKSLMKPKSLEKILAGSKKQHKGYAIFGETDKNEPYDFRKPIEVGTDIWQPRLYSQEDVRCMVQEKSDNKVIEIFVLYKDNTLRRFSELGREYDVLLEETMVTKIPENEQHFEYLKEILEKQWERNAVQSTYVLRNYVPQMK